METVKRSALLAALACAALGCGSAFVVAPGTSPDAASPSADAANNPAADASALEPDAGAVAPDGGAAADASAAADAGHPDDASAPEADSGSPAPDAGPPHCGDGLCNGSETCASCPADCKGLCAASEFYLVQEYFHDGGDLARIESADLGINAASFKAVLTTAEQAFLASHPAFFSYFTLPHELIQPTVAPHYPWTLDPGYAATMAGLVSSYGGARMYLFAMPEWDNDPPNLSWAYKRFSEAGVGGDRPDIPTDLTRREAYDQWMHFYLADNTDGSSHHQLGRLLSPTYPARGYKVQANSVNAGSCFYAYEMGVDLVTLQRVNDDVSGLVGGIALVRGAAAQYGRDWGIDVSGWRSTYWPARPTAYDASGNLSGGWSAGVFRRTHFLSYMAGPLTIFEEGQDYTSNGRLSVNGRLYTPRGAELRDFADFAIVRHPAEDRGTPHVPIAIMKDHLSFWEPHYGQWNQQPSVWYQQMPANGGERMLFNLYDLIFPGYHTWGSATDASEPMGSGRWGEQFNVVTERIEVPALALHQAVILSTDAPMDAALQAKLTAYAQAGGVVVINARQLSGTAHTALTGVQLTDVTSESGTITWAADSSTTNEAPFTYSTVNLTTATALAHSRTGAPQVTRNLVGAGEVWVTMPAYLSNQANDAALGLAAKVIDVLIERFSVASVTSTGANTMIDYAVNRRAGTDGRATAVTIVNNDVTGAPWAGTLSFPGVVGVVTEWVADAPVACSAIADRLTCDVSVAGGDARVFALRR